MNTPKTQHRRDRVYGVLDNNQLIYESVSPNPSRTLRAFKRLHPERYKEGMTADNSQSVGLEVGEFQIQADSPPVEPYIGPMR